MLRRLGVALAIVIVLGLGLGLGACGDTGTLAIDLVLPGGKVPDGTTQVRVVAGPSHTQTVPVGSDGSFSLSFEFDASSTAGTVHVDLLDAGGNVLARGTSPFLPFDGASGRVKIFVAPPQRFSPAPFDVVARADLALAPLSYGVLLAGGRDADGTRSAALGVFSVAQQTFTAGLDLPAAKAGLVAVGTSTDSVLLYGGLGTGDAVTGDFWFFDTTVAPKGAYLTLPAVPALARTGAQVAPLGKDKFLVTGDPPALLDGAAGTLTGFANAPAGAGQATALSSTTSGSTVIVILAGPTGLYRYDATADAWSTIDATARPGAAAVTLPDGRVLVAAGGATTLVSSDGTVTAGPAVGARDRPATAVTAGSIVLAGGFTADGAGRNDADLIDADTLAVTTIPLAAPRGAPAAIALPNQTILVVGGRDRSGGAPQAGAEIFTP